MNDLISRTKLMEALDKKCTRYENHLVVPGWWTAMEVIEEQPTVDVEVVHGKWTLHDDGSATCSNCRRRSLWVWDFDNSDNFCKHCGADMRGRY